MRKKIRKRPNVILFMLSFGYRQYRYYGVSHRREAYVITKEAMGMVT